MRRVFSSFLQMKAAEPGAPEVAGYEAQSGGILPMMEGLKTKFKKELGDEEEEDAEEMHHYEVDMLHLKDSIARYTQDRDGKASMKAQRASESGAAKGKLAATKAALAQDRDGKA